MTSHFTGGVTGTDPNYFTPREHLLPDPISTPQGEAVISMVPDKEGWVAACTEAEVPPGEMLRFDVGVHTYVVYHAEDDGLFYATAGMCTHGAASLADGLMTPGNLIECPKHNGCFDFKTGLPKRLPVRKQLATFPVKTEEVFGVRQVYVQVTDGKHRQISYDEDEDE
jgi:3-phenylpropionate/trans-cinnamate dioxygenase ferredoxin subunit